MPDDELVLPDGTVLVRVWHGAKVHPVTGVKGGLLSYPAPPDPGAADDSGAPAAPAATPAGALVRCPVCGAERVLPGWLARRFRTCSRSCAMEARHKARGGGMGCLPANGA